MCERNGSGIDCWIPRNCGDREGKHRRQGTGGAPERHYAQQLI